MAGSECPFCGERGLRIVYGLFPGPPAPGEVAGGCSIFPGRSPDFECPWCDAEWIEKRAGITVVTALGANQESDLPKNAVSVLALDDAAAQIRTQLDSNRLSDDDLHKVITEVGKSIGLNARQSTILMEYI